MTQCNFAPAIACGTETHRQGGQLDQVFTRNVEEVNAMASGDYGNDISDNKCLKVTVKLKQH